MNDLEIVGLFRLGTLFLFSVMCLAYMYGANAFYRRLLLALFVASFIASLFLSSGLWVAALALIITFALPLIVSPLIYVYIMFISWRSTSKDSRRINLTFSPMAIYRIL